MRYRSAGTLLLVLIFACAVQARHQAPPTTIRLAIVDFGSSSFARRAAEAFASNLKLADSVVIFDLDQASAAARGAGYSGSLNLSLDEARDLGAALGCDFYFLGDAQTIARSPFDGPRYYESYASIFLVSARTGRLHAWERPTHNSEKPELAERKLTSELAGAELRSRFIASLRHAEEIERGERAGPIDRQTPVIEAAPDDDKTAAAEGLRLPKPFRRFLPPYPDTAARAEVEAIVDVLVDLDDRGEVKRVEVARWAGFGLDQATIDTVRRMHFFPAMRDGVAVPMRVLLRYNFRTPPK